MQCRGVNLFVDDLVTGQGDVFGRAATILRAIESKPLFGKIDFKFFLSQKSVLFLINFNKCPSIHFPLNDYRNTGKLERDTENIETRRRGCEGGREETEAYVSKRETVR